jgi:hypothetical protein
MTPSGIENATYRFVAQYLIHYATAHPQDLEGLNENNGNKYVLGQQILYD